MGFLDNLLKREARKLVAGVLDEVVDTVTDNIRDSVKDGNTSGSKGNTKRQNAGGQSVYDPESDCCFSSEVVADRICTVVSEEWGDQIDFRMNIKTSEIGAEPGALECYTYGIYHEGKPVAMVVILDPPADDYWNKRTRLAKEACEYQNIGYVHFITRLPNRTSYIREQLKKVVNI